MKTAVEYMNMAQGQSDVGNFVGANHFATMSIAASMIESREAKVDPDVPKNWGGLNIQAGPRFFRVFDRGDARGLGFCLVADERKDERRTRLGNLTDRRRFLLEGYPVKRRAQDRRTSNPIKEYEDSRPTGEWTTAQDSSNVDPMTRLHRNLFSNESEAKERIAERDATIEELRSRVRYRDMTNTLTEQDNRTKSKIIHHLEAEAVESSERAGIQNARIRRLEAGLRFYAEKDVWHIVPSEEGQGHRDRYWIEHLGYRYPWDMAHESITGFKARGSQVERGPEVE